MNRPKPHFSKRDGVLFFRQQMADVGLRGRSKFTARKRGTLFLGELTDTFRFQADFPDGPHEPLPMWSPQENEPLPLPDNPPAPPLLGKTNDAPAIPSLAAFQTATPTPPLPPLSQSDGLMTPNPEPCPLIVNGGRGRSLIVD